MELIFGFQMVFTELRQQDKPACGIFARKSVTDLCTTPNGIATPRIPSMDFAQTTSILGVR
jgi:hypothetical protein